MAMHAGPTLARQPTFCHVTSSSSRGHSRRVIGWNALFAGTGAAIIISHHIRTSLSALVVCEATPLIRVVTLGTRATLVYSLVARSKQQRLFTVAACERNETENLLSSDACRTCCQRVFWIRTDASFSASTSHHERLLQQ